MSGAKIAMNTKAVVITTPTQNTVRANRLASRHGLSQRSGTRRSRRRKTSVSDARVDIGIKDVDEHAY